MTLSQYAGVAIVPTLARIVLAAAFVSAGWNKVFKDGEFTAAEATKLKSMGVNVEPAQQKTVSAATWSDARFVLASYRQEVPADNAAPGTLRTPGEGTQSQQPQGEQPQDPVIPPANPENAPPAATVPAAQGTAPDAGAVGPLAPGIYKAQALHYITLMLADKDFPNPLWLARLTAFTELVGGAMLLIGLFSRIWGLGLAVAMGGAFYLITMQQNGIFRMDPRTFAEDLANFNTAYRQAGLFVLAFGVFLTGAGPLSIDRILFGGPREPGVDEVKID